jgi:hypothetical protein
LSPPYKINNHNLPAEVKDLLKIQNEEIGKDDDVYEENDDVFENLEEYVEDDSNFDLDGVCEEMIDDFQLYNDNINYN